MLVPCRCDCHTDPLPYCDECCDGPVSLYEQLDAAEAKLAEAERERDAEHRRADLAEDRAVVAEHDRGFVAGALRAAESREKASEAKLAEAERERDEALQRAETAESVQVSMTLAAEHAQDALAVAGSREKALRGFLWTLRYGDGCMCEGGPFDPRYPHTDRCRSWQAELTDEHRAALAAGKETG